MNRQAQCESPLEGLNTGISRLQTAL
jgi:hypothetical protein